MTLRTCITTDRVILVPGPAHEVQVVKGIYRMLVSEKLSIPAIARELDRRAVRYLGASEWDYQAVYAVLTSLKYIGCHAFGRTSCKLSTPPVSLPKSELGSHPPSLRSDDRRLDFFGGAENLASAHLQQVRSGCAGRLAVFASFARATLSLSNKELC